MGASAVCREGVTRLGQQRMTRAWKAFFHKKLEGVRVASKGLSILRCSRQKTGDTRIGRDLDKGSFITVGTSKVERLPQVVYLY